MNSTLPKQLERTGWLRLKFWSLYRQAGLAQEVDYHTFQALELTPKHQVKAVILGDPNRWGLAWCSLPHVKPIPRTTRNVLTEYASDLGYRFPRTGDLRPWCRRGVLLLPVRLGRSPQWELLTYEICRQFDVPMLLWGQGAQQFKPACKGPIFTTSHPGPLTCHDGFLGSKPFTWCNDRLARGSRINWELI